MATASVEVTDSAVASPPPVADAAVVSPEAAAAPAAETPAINISNEAELTALKTLADMGITPDNAQEYIQAKAALTSLNQTLATDPDVMLAQLEQTNPDAYFKLMDRATDRYLKHFPPESEDGGKGSAVAADPRISAIEQELAAFKARDQQAQVATRARGLEAEYTKRLDGLIAQAAEKANLSEKDKKLLRYETNTRLVNDERARQRLQAGVFADLPGHFAEALKDVMGDAAKSAAKESGAREQVKSKGTISVPNAAENVGGAAPAFGADMWDDAAASFAADWAKQKH